MNRPEVDVDADVLLTTEATTAALRTTRVEPARRRRRVADPRDIRPHELEHTEQEDPHREH